MSSMIQPGLGPIPSARSKSVSPDPSGLREDGLKLAPLVLAAQRDRAQNATPDHRKNALMLDQLPVDIGMRASS